MAEAEHSNPYHPGDRVRIAVWCYHQLQRWQGHAIGRVHSVDGPFVQVEFTDLPDHVVHRELMTDVAYHWQDVSPVPQSDRPRTWSYDPDTGEVIVHRG